MQRALVGSADRKCKKRSRTHQLAVFEPCPAVHRLASEQLAKESHANEPFIASAIRSLTVKKIQRGRSSNGHVGHNARRMKRFAH